MPDRPYARADEREERPRRPWLDSSRASCGSARGNGHRLSPLRPSRFQVAGGVVVGDYTGMTQAQAQQAVVNAGLRTRFTKSASETVPPDHVIRQSPPAGTKVEKNQVVELFISNGKPLLGLDDVRGYSVNDAAAHAAARTALRSRSFGASTTRVKDNVIDQMPKPGAKVPEGSRVTLIVSDGPRAGRHAQLRRHAGRRPHAQLPTRSESRSTRRRRLPGIPPDTIASQNIAQGTKVDRNAIVRVVVNSGVPNASPTPEGNGPIVSLPNVVGQDYDSARQIADASRPSNSPCATSCRAPTTAGSSTQTPPAGQVPQGSPVRSRSPFRAKSPIRMA